MFNQKYLSLSILLVTISLQGCELGVDPSNEVTPNYNLLSNCEKPENTLLANIIEGVSAAPYLSLRTDPP